MDDVRIIELYFARNEQAIRETAAKYGKICLKIAHNILHSREDSEECVNDTYLGVWRAIPPARPGNFKAFICRITRNLSLKRLEFLKREKRSADVLVSIEELSEVLPDERYAPGMQDEEIGEHISRFLREQKEDVRKVFIRRYFYFDTVEEIAGRFSFSEAKVKNMLFRTRNKLREYLTREGVEL
ncbi:MAG: RNA polymerase sigma factor [Lachnospiraceae bacterium]|nr:RNA polymerase sigma factor [Lachnospiraceae bacterium]